MQRTTISKVWNTPADRAAVDALVKGKGYYINRRGRGHRFGRRSYWQALPLELATTITYYLDPKSEFEYREGTQYVKAECPSCGFMPGPEIYGHTCPKCTASLITQRPYRYRTRKTWSYLITERFEYRGVDRRSGKVRVRRTS